MPFWWIPIPTGNPVPPHELEAHVRAVVKKHKGTLDPDHVYFTLDRKLGHALVRDGDIGAIAGELQSRGALPLLRSDEI